MIRTFNRFVRYTVKSSKVKISFMLFCTFDICKCKNIRVLIDDRTNYPKLRFINAIVPKYQKIFHDILIELSVR